MHAAHTKIYKLQKVSIKISEPLTHGSLILPKGAQTPMEFGFEVKTLTLVEVVHNVDVSMI